MHFIYLFTFSYHLMHSFVWLSKWISLLQHRVQSLHYFSHTPLVWLVFNLFCCCFSRIENVKSYSDVLAHLAMYMETVWAISRWWFNLCTHWSNAIAELYLFIHSLYLLASCVFPVSSSHNRVVKWCHHRHSRKLVPTSKGQKHTLAF
jgi:hypothetical protein